MSGVLFLVGPDDEHHGMVEILSDKVEWSYTGPDPDGEVKDYLEHVENKDAYDWHEEVPDDKPGFDDMYLLEIYEVLDYLDYPHRVLPNGL